MAASWYRHGCIVVPGMAAQWYQEWYRSGGTVPDPVPVHHPTRYRTRPPAGVHGVIHALSGPWLTRGVHQATFLKEAREPGHIKEQWPVQVSCPGVKTGISGKIHSGLALNHRYILNYCQNRE